MKRFSRKTIVLAVACSAILASGLIVAAANYALFGDAQLVSPGFNSPTAAQVRSSATIAPNYGGIDFSIPGGLTVANLDTLSTDYQFIDSTCGGGSPRFQINVIDPNDNQTKNIFVYLGDAPGYTGCTQNIWSNTGNLLAPTNAVDTAQLGGGPYMTYADAQAAYGNYEITGIQLVADGSWLATQTLQADNVVINNQTFTFESAESCKKGGFTQFTNAPGPFKNQGQCVSYFAKGGQ